METRLALAGFSALSHPVRLGLFRALVRCAPDGVAAGELAEQFDTPPSTMTGHLQTLERAGLIRSERRSRRIIYALDPDGTRALVDFVIEDCCDNRAELCSAKADRKPAHQTS